jgi:hypothetical protein
VSWIDSLIYKLIATIFKIILYLADIQVLREGIINDLTNKVYAFLAVLMFFKIAISTIQYIVNPDELSNSDKGIGGILKNSAIAIILLVVVPEIFAFARSKQSYIASYIPTIILDVEYTGEGSSKHVELVRKEADEMATTTFNAFVLQKSGNGLAPIGRSSPNGTFNWDVARSDDDKEHNAIEGSIYYGCKKDCVDAVLFKFCIPSFSDADCSYRYMMVWSTISGVLMAFVLVSMAVDVAIRAIKLSILEVMAPIPIVSYIDKAKGGAFEAWLKECKDVYIDLFIRLIIIYFAVFLIREISADFGSMTSGIFSSMQGENTEIKALVFVFLIIGLLLFAKNAPKFIMDILGIKGNDTISGMFKRAGGLMGSVLGTGKSGIAGAYNKYQKAKAANGGEWKPGDRKKRNQALRQAALSGLRSTRSAAWAGTRSALSGKGFKETRDAASRAADRTFDLYEARKDAHVKWRDYQKELIKRRIGIRQDLEALNAELKAAQESSDKAKAALDYVHSNMGAKFADVRFATDYLTRMAGKIKGTKLEGDPSNGGKFVVGYTKDGVPIQVSMADMAEGGKFSINGVMNQLQKTMKDEDGSMLAGLTARMKADARKSIMQKYEQDKAKIDQDLYDADAQIDADIAAGKIDSTEGAKRKKAALDKATADAEALKKARDGSIAKAEEDASVAANDEMLRIQSEAQAMLDQLQGFADSFVVSTAGRTDMTEAEKLSRYGFTENPAFSRIIEEAKSAIKMNSSSNFGVETQREGQTSGMVDAHGDALDGMLGDWLGLNKKAGQKAQTQSLSTQTSDPKVAAQAAAKKIADQYDKKS